MKFIYCRLCEDVVMLTNELRHCACGESSGQYTDRLNAEIAGPCVPLGFSNDSFIEAVTFQPKHGPRKEFTAFVIERDCKTIKKKEPI